MQLGDGEQLRRMHIVPVAELVREDSLDLVGLALLHEGVEDDDVLGLGER